MRHHPEIVTPISPHTGTMSPPNLKANRVIVPTRPWEYVPYRKSVRQTLTRLSRIHVVKALHRGTRPLQRVQSVKKLRDQVPSACSIPFAKEFSSTCLEFWVPSAASKSPRDVLPVRGIQLLPSVLPLHFGLTLPIGNVDIS